MQRKNKPVNTNSYHGAPKADNDHFFQHKIIPCPNSLLLTYMIDLGTSFKVILLHFIKSKALLKLIVDFATKLIGAEGTRLLREKQVKGDPTGA